MMCTYQLTKNACCLTQERAILADSCMTEPSWPVRVSPESPLEREASTTITSPPTGVQASPTATPGTLTRPANPLSNIGGWKIKLQCVRSFWDTKS